MSTCTSINPWIARALLLGLFLAHAARAQNFAWLSGSHPATPGITTTIPLTDQNVAQVDALLASRTIKALKIEQPLSQGTVNAIFNKYKIDYTFIDYEGDNATPRTAALVNQIRASAATGPAIGNNKAFVSNYDYSQAYTDPTASYARPGNAAYVAAGVNMASDSLYPGSWMYRNPASGNSSAPNIRSALFTMPIQRLSYTSSAAGGLANVPYVNRFNNWGNDALDSDHNPSNGYQFVTSNQLPSRGDFQAQILHYRLRGATGVHGLDGGVVGYTQQQFEQDIQAGWSSIAGVNSILADSRYRLATLDTYVKSDGSSKSLEDAGVAISGAYSLTQGRMALLLSNLDEIPHSLGLASQYGGKLAGGNYLVDAGEHRILEFGLSGMTWNLISNQEVFDDANRAGTGIPEPGTLALLVAAMPLLLRRRTTARA